MQNILCNENMNVFSVDNFDEVINANFKQDTKKPYILRKAILLETRLSKKIPEFNFNEMANDRVIIEFEKIVNKRLRGVQD